MEEIVITGWDQYPPLLSLTETAKILRRGYRCALDLCHTPGFPALRVGRTWRVSRDGLRRWVETQASGR